MVPTSSTRSILQRKPRSGIRQCRALPPRRHHDVITKSDELLGPSELLHLRLTVSYIQQQ